MAEQRHVEGPQQMLAVGSSSHGSPENLDITPRAPLFLPETQFLRAFAERFLRANLPVLLVRGAEGLQIPAKVELGPAGVKMEPK